MLLQLRIPKPFVLFINIYYASKDKLYCLLNIGYLTRLSYSNMYPIGDNSDDSSTQEFKNTKGEKGE